jgi:hypothetical protein
VLAQEPVNPAVPFCFGNYVTRIIKMPVMFRTSAYRACGGWVVYSCTWKCRLHLQVLMPNWLHGYFRLTYNNQTVAPSELVQAFVSRRYPAPISCRTPTIVISWRCFVTPYNNRHSSALVLTGLPVGYHLITGPQLSTVNWLLVKVKVTLRPTVSQPVSRGVKPHRGPKTRFMLLSESCGFIDVGHPLWQADGSVIYRGHSQ